MSRSPKDITGMVYANLTAIGLFEIVKSQRLGVFHVWTFRCSCGNLKNIQKGKVVGGQIKSCGCGSPWIPKHGMHTTRFYSIWKGMKRRCLNANSSCYKNYGGRGIKVCDEWIDFKNFRVDMYESYVAHSKKNGESMTSIDRIDVNGNYHKENCRWATPKEQTKNRRVKPVKTCPCCGRRMKRVITS